MTLQQITNNLIGCQTRNITQAHSPYVNISSESITGTFSEKTADFWIVYA